MAVSCIMMTMMMVVSCIMMTMMMAVSCIMMTMMMAVSCIMMMMVVVVSCIMMMMVVVVSCIMMMVVVVVVSCIMMTMNDDGGKLHNDNAERQALCCLWSGATCRAARRTGCAAGTRKGHASPSCPPNQRHATRCGEFSSMKTWSWRSWWRRRRSTRVAKPRAARGAPLSCLPKVRESSQQHRWNHTYTAHSNTGEITPTQLTATKVKSHLHGSQQHRWYHTYTAHSSTGEIAWCTPTQLTATKVRSHRAHPYSWQQQRWDHAEHTYTVHSNKSEITQSTPTQLQRVRPTQLQRVRPTQLRATKVRLHRAHLHSYKGWDLHSSEQQRWGHVVHTYTAQSTTDEFTQYRPTKPLFQ